MYSIKDMNRHAITVIIAVIFSCLLFISQTLADVIAHYHFDGDATDASGNGYDLEIVPDTVEWTDGIHGLGAFIKSVEISETAVMEGPTYLTKDGGDWTIEAWLNMPGPDDDCYFIHLNPFALIVDWQNIMFACYYEEMSKQDPLCITKPPSAAHDKWFHIAGVYRYKESIQIYVNGNLIGEREHTQEPWFNQVDSGFFRIGRGPQYSENGYTIDEVVISNAALKPEEFVGMQYYEPPEAIIAVKITDSTYGASLYRASVTVTPGDYSTLTNIDGDYEVYVTGDQEYTVTVEKTDYNTVSQTAISVKTDETAEVNIALEFSTSSSTVAIYHFDGNVTDARGNGNDLTIMDENSITWTEGINGQAVLFTPVESTTRGVVHGPDNLLKPGDYTIEAWFKVANFENLWIVITQLSPFVLYIGRAGYITFQGNTSGPLSNQDDYPIVYSFLPLSVMPGQWFHVAGVYRYKENLQIYINGELIAEHNTSFAPAFENPSDPYFYLPGNLRNIAGWIAVDEFAIHNAALAPEEFIGMQYYKTPDAFITGRITDSFTGEGMSSAIITVMPGNYGTITDSNGDYSVSVAGEQDYTITAKTSNYKPVTQENVSAASGATIDVSASLERFSTSPTTAYYHFDGDGTDASGNGYDFEVNEKISWIDGIHDKAAFIGKNMSRNERSFITSDYGPLYPGYGDWTIEMLVKFPDNHSFMNDGIVQLNPFTIKIHPKNDPPTNKFIVIVMVRKLEMA